MRRSSRPSAQSGKPALMTVFRNEGQWDTSNVWFEDGRIRLYDKRERLPQMQHIDWGLGVLRARGACRAAGERSRSISRTSIPICRAPGKLAGYEVTTRFYEIGSAEGLARDRRAAAQGSELVAGRLAVLVEHLHGLERVFVHVLADQRQLLDDVVGHRDDLAADLVGLEDVEQLARARPDQLGIGRGSAAASPTRP